MVKKILVSVVLTLGLLAPTAFASAQPMAEEQAQAASSTSIRGKWRGPVKLEDGTSAGFKINVVIWKKDGRLVGRAWRSDGLCTAKFTFKRWQGGWAHFRMTITRGIEDCHPRHTPARMRREGSKLRIRGYNPEANEGYYALASRVS